MTERSIADGRVRLLGAVDAPGVSAWAPITHRHAVPAAATITLATTARPLRTAGASRPRDLAWGDLHAWVEHPAASVVMHAGPAAAPRLVGAADLPRGTATVTVPHSAAVADVAGALLLASGILLAQHGHLLMHAGAIVAPTGEAWLLVGDTHSGKSTTVATLIAAGWRWVADDTVVVTADATGTLTAAGWVRQPHLDSGYATGSIAGTRRPCQPDERGPFAMAQWCPTAPIAGVLLPRVVADQPTTTEDVSPGIVLRSLLRQSPWSMALGGTAAAHALALLQTLATGPCAALRLGRDAYAAPAVLTAAVAPSITAMRARTVSR